MDEKRKYRSLDDLPLAMTVEDVAAALGISRAKAYQLVYEEGFPAFRIGRRIVVPKSRFITWLQDKEM